MSYGLSERAMDGVKAIAARHLYNLCFYHCVVDAEDKAMGFEKWKRMQVIGYCVPEWISWEELFELCDEQLREAYFGKGDEDEV